jgi:transposase, IS5 family
VIGRETIAELHDRMVAQERKVVSESNIHYPTDSGLLNDGTRVLTRTMKQIEQKVGGLKRKVRDRKRSVRKRVIAIAHALRHKGSG